MLLDEPLSNLDVALKEDLLDQFTQLLEERGATVLYVTHDPFEAERVGTGLAVIEDGKVVFDGVVGELPQDAATAFLGRVSTSMKRKNE